MRLTAITIIAGVFSLNSALAQESAEVTAIPNTDPANTDISQFEQSGQWNSEEILERLKAAEEKIAELSVDKSAASEKEKPEKKEEKKKSWFEKYKLGGYMQVRLNETLLEEPGSALAQHVGDSSVGRNNEFLIRRARLIFEGDVSDRIFVYLQPEFAGTVPNSTDSIHYAFEIGIPISTSMMIRSIAFA
jgi:hypothetical protein